MAASGDRRTSSNANSSKRTNNRFSRTSRPVRISRSNRGDRTRLRDNSRRAIRHCRARRLRANFRAPGGAIPDVGDPFVDQTAEAQYGANKQAAVDEAQLNRITQQTPWGTLEYVYDPTTGETTQTTTLNPEDQARLDQWRQRVRQLTRRHVQRRS